MEPGLPHIVGPVYRIDIQFSDRTEIHISLEPSAHAFVGIVCKIGRRLCSLGPNLAT